MPQETMRDYLPHLKISLLEGLKIIFLSNEARVLATLCLPSEQIDIKGNQLGSLCQDTNCPLPFSYIPGGVGSPTLGGPMTAREISIKLNISESLVKRELNKLRRKGIITSRKRKGTTSKPPMEFYITNETCIALLKLLLQIQEDAIVGNFSY